MYTFIHWEFVHKIKWRISFCCWDNKGHCTSLETYCCEKEKEQQILISVKILTCFVSLVGGASKAADAVPFKIKFVPFKINLLFEHSWRNGLS